MEALIIEDEKLAQLRLSKMLEAVAPDIEIVGMTKSVRDSVEWLRSQEHAPDVIFMDVELEDGTCFEIFHQCRVTSNVVMVTAYNKYAINAFEVGCVDYLLKPIDQSMLHRSLERCRANRNVVDAERLLSALGRVLVGSDANAMPAGYRKRFVIREGEQFVPVSTKDVAYIYSEDRANYIVTMSGKRHIVNLSLDLISDQLSPYDFFRISRTCIIAVGAIRSIVRLKGGRLKILTDAEPCCDLTVSRTRAADFLVWFS